MSVSSKLSSVRADSLAAMITILQLFGPEDSVSIKSLYGLLSDKWRRSRSYHYVSALQQLGLVSMNKRILALTSSARLLLKNAKHRDFDSDDLSQEEKAAFKEILKGFRPFVDFMSLFLKTGGRFHSYEQFFADGSHITLHKRTTKFYKNKFQDVWTIQKADGTPEDLESSKHKELYWTLKYWAKSLDLIDELHPEVDRAYSSRVHDTLFPVKIRDVSLEEFMESLLALLRHNNLFNKRIAVPELMYRYCTSFFIRTHEFLSKLVNLYLTKPGVFRLEKMSRAYIDEKPNLVKGYSNYPQIRNTYYGTIVIRDPCPAGDIDEGRRKDERRGIR